MPNLRGGGEYGEDWHKAGMRANKQNVFDDFIAAAEYLIDEKATRAPDQLAIRGGSNGGLLVGAALTQRPELFRAVICAVPLLDMVRYHLFGSGKTWVPEYGSPEDEAEFGLALRLLAVSPRQAGHQVSGAADDVGRHRRPRRPDARAQVRGRAAGGAGRRATDDRPMLLRIEKHSGHGGADLVKQAVEQSADAYAFLMYELGMKP